jgi:hypothetical protein
MRLDISHTTPLFGPAAEHYGPIVRTAISRLRNVPYRFYDNDEVLKAVKEGTIGAPEVNAIAVGELLISAHLAAVTSIIRASRWMEATWREYEAENLLGWAGCCRSLLEAVGDTAHSLGRIAIGIAEQIPLLRKAMNGLDDFLVVAEEIEIALLHFSHARKLTKGERASEHPSHAARQTFEYIDALGKAGLSDASPFYAELCQIGHPARASLSWLYEPIEGGFLIDECRDKREIDRTVGRYSRTLHDLPSVAFNPGLLILRVLVKFRMFPAVPELRRFDFAGAKAWTNIEPMLRG